MEKAGSRNSTVCVGSCCMLNIRLGPREREIRQHPGSQICILMSPFIKPLIQSLATPSKCCWKLGSLFLQLSMGSYSILKNRFYILFS